MVAAANKHATMTITSTEDTLQGFEKLKHMVNTCPVLYFINNTYKIVLYTDASGYAHGAYLCQIKPATETSAGADQVPKWNIQRRANKMVHYRKGSVRDILGAKEAGRLTRRDIAFTIKTDHRNLLYMNNHGSRKVLQWKLDIQSNDILQRNDRARPRSSQNTG